MNKFVEIATRAQRLANERGEGKRCAICNAAPPDDWHCEDFDDWRG